MPLQEHDYAFIVGVDHYPDFHPLEGAIADAKAFEAWVRDDRAGGGVSEGHCAAIYSQPNPLRPIQDEIDDALLDLFAKCSNGDARRLYFYFSGHGLSAERLGVDLCLPRWSNQLRRYALSMLDYYEMIVSSGHFRELVVLLDCCRVRKVRARGRAPAFDFARPDDNAGRDRSWIGFATEYQNTAHEAAVTRDRPLLDEDRVVRGYFTRALLDGLRGAAARPAGGVTASDLKKYVERETDLISRSTQNCEVLNGFLAANDPIFGSALPEANVAIYLAPGTGTVSLIGPDGETMRQGDRSSSPWNVTLDKGIHLLVDDKTGARLTIQFVPSEDVRRVDF